MLVKSWNQHWTNGTYTCIYGILLTILNTLSEERLLFHGCMQTVAKRKCIACIAAASGGKLSAIFCACFGSHHGERSKLRKLEGGWKFRFSGASELPPSYRDSIENRQFGGSKLPSLRGVTFSNVCAFVCVFCEACFSCIMACERPTFAQKGAKNAGTPVCVSRILVRRQASGGLSPVSQPWAVPTKCPLLAAMAECCKATC